METIQLTCIGCPLGCPVSVTMESGQPREVKGNTCPRGEAYARKEVTAPTRIVTTTVRVSGSQSGAVTVSCKTRSDIPKGEIFNCVRALKGLTVPAPIHIGDVLASNVAGTDIVATREIL